MSREVSSNRDIAAVLDALEFFPFERRIGEEEVPHRVQASRIFIAEKFVRFAIHVGQSFWFIHQHHHGRDRI